jgi:hypothetical protein
MRPDAATTVRPMAACSLRVLSLILSASLAMAGCALEPPSASPEDAQALARARSEAKEAELERTSIEQERSGYAAEIGRKQAELAELDAGYQASLSAHRARVLAHEGYTAALAAAQDYADDCEGDMPFVRLVLGAGIAAELGVYGSYPDRDAALDRMESCRVQQVKEARKLMKVRIKELREGYAVDIEDAFDTNNPYSRGGLVAKVSGTTLSVKMRGNFEGRARHSQDQVDDWCDAADGLFTAITLSNSHGRFTCTPAESPSAFMARLLDETGGTSSWKQTGELAIPSDPGPAPARPPGLTSQRDKLVGEIERIEAANAKLDPRSRDAAVMADQAHQREAAVARKQTLRVDEWGVQANQRASRTIVAGAVLAGIGALTLGVTVGSQTQSQAGGTAAKQVLPIGVGISVPVLVTGFALIIGGSVRKGRIRDKLSCLRGTGGCR